MKNVMLHLLFLIFAILGAPYLILHSSRYVSYFKVFFKTLIALFLLYSPKDRDGTSVWEGTLYTLSVIVLFPFAFAKALDTVVQGGKIFWITDDELYQEPYILRNTLISYSVQVLSILESLLAYQ